MKRKVSIVLFVLAFSQLAYSQVNIKPVKLANADAKNAIKINDSIVGPVNVSDGRGNILDFKLDRYIVEENSAWFKLTILQDTLLTFDIVPVDSAEDYDFIFFKCADKNCLSDIKTKKQIPDRICFSYNPSKSGNVYSLLVPCIKIRNICFLMKPQLL